jgi:predicted ferric reductase
MMRPGAPGSLGSFGRNGGQPVVGSGVTREGRIRVAAVGYAVIVLTPLFVVLVGPGRAERGFWVEFGVALGFIGLAMLGLQSVLTARFPRVSSSLGQDALLQFHRQAGIVAFGFVLAHPVILLMADGDNWEYLDLRVNFLRAAFLIIVLVALPAIIVTSLWREQLHLPYEWWRLAHGALAVLIVLIGLVHIMRVQYYLSSLWKQALWLLIGSASIGCVLYVRAIQPLRVRRRPHTVSSVEEIADRTWSVTVIPDDGEVFDFRAGQFAFVTIAGTPFSLEEHPFSLASSPHRREAVEFAVKELGDYTDRIGDIAPGSRAFVDGPYGSMQLPDDDPPGLVLIAGGIGITPIVSMLRALRDTGSQARIALVYANRTVDEIAYGDEIASMRDDLDLTLVHVLEDPPVDWEGATGMITPELLDDLVPDHEADRWWYVLCGPPPMMEAVEGALVDLGVPIGRIESERFDIGSAGMIGRRGVGIRRTVLALGAVMLAAAALFAW